VLDLRRKPGKQHLAERQYNAEKREFVLREKTPDFKARKIGEDIEIDVSTSKLFDEQLTIRSKYMVKRDELIARKKELEKQNKVLFQRRGTRVKRCHSNSTKLKRSNG
jgi:hypothetical protein